jgi:hypothetical protein
MKVAKGFKRKDQPWTIRKDVLALKHNIIELENVKERAREFEDDLELGRRQPVVLPPRKRVPMILHKIVLSRMGSKRLERQRMGDGIEVGWDDRRRKDVVLSESERVRDNLRASSDRCSVVSSVAIEDIHYDSYITFLMAIKCFGCNIDCSICLDFSKE